MHPHVAPAVWMITVRDYLRWCFIRLRDMQRQQFGFHPLDKRCKVAISTFDDPVRHKTLVIDAKYYAHTTQSQYNTNTLHSGNLYQIFTYVKNLDTSNSGNIAGMLLYDKTDEIVLPNNDYKMGGNQISVKTLDLDCEFAEIKRQLDDIAQRYFGCS